MRNISITFKKELFNEVYLPFLEDETKILVFYGGGGSGKSYFIVQRYVFKLLKNDMCNLMAVRAVADTNRDSTFALFKQVISNWGLNRFFKINASNMSIVCTLNRNCVIFKGLDNVEKLKSVTFEKGELTDVWLEEATEAEEGDLNQLIIRLRGGKAKKQIVLSFNPINANHWLKKRFFDRKERNTKVLKTTYKDNKFLQKEDIETLESFKETDFYYYSVYCLGQWGVYGKTIFSAANVQERINKNIKPVKTGYFTYDDDGLSITNIQFIEDENGYIKIYEDVKQGYPYVIGGDTAGEGSDYFVGQVIDNVSGSQVAVLRHEFDEDLYARQIYCLGKYFNTALISIEANYTTHPIKELLRLKYPKQFVRMIEDKYTFKQTESFGFKTTPVTRPIIIAELVKVVREHPELIFDYDTLDEMLTFVRNEKGRPEAQNGAHDDCIMALAIAHYSREQMDRFAEDDSSVLKKAVWEDDQWEDYYNADEEEKKLMISMWGNPF